MHILVILTFGNSFLDWQEAGILERELLIYKKLNEKYNISFSFLTFGDKRDDEIVDNFNVIPFYKHNKKSKNKYVNLLRSVFFAFKLNNFVNKPNIIKTNQLMGSWVGIIAKFIFKSPLLVRTGYDIFRFSIFEKKNFIKKISYYFLTQVSIFFCDLYSVTSRADLNFLKKYFLGTKKIVIVPNWVQTRNLQKNKCVLDSKARSILSVGRLENQKNFSELINQFSNSIYKIDIVGTGSKYKNLKKLAEQKNVSVNFIGKLNNNDLNKLYQNYKFYITTSKFEGNSKSLLEAKAAGCIVIAKENDNISDVITNNVDGIVYKEEFIPNIIDELNNNINKAKSISYYAQKNVAACNSLKTICLKEFDNYKKILKSN